MSAINTSQADPIAPPHGGPLGDGLSGGVYATWTRIPGELAALAAERARAEESCRAVHEARVRRADEARNEALQSAEQKKQAESEELERLVASARSAAAKEFQAESGAAESALQTLRKTATVRYRRTHEDAHKTHEAARWEAGTIFETAEKGANETRKEAKGKLAHAAEELKALKEATANVLELFRGYLVTTESEAPPPEPVTVAPEADPFPALQTEIEAADATLIRLEQLGLPRAFRGLRMIWVFVLPAMALAYPSWYLLGPIYGPIACLALAIAVGYGLRRWIIATSRRRIESLRVPLMESLARADRLVAEGEAYITETHGRRVREATARRDAEFGRADRVRDEVIESATKARDAKLSESEEEATRRLTEIVARRDHAVRQAAETESHRRHEIASQYEAEIAAAKARHRAAIQDAEAKRAADWNTLAHRWESGLRTVADQARAIHAAIDGRFPDFAGSPSWTPGATIPDAIRIGEVAIALDRIPGGVSRDERLRKMAPDAVRLPALLDFPERASVAFDFNGEEGRKRAVEGMQAVMLRFLTGLPPGKVRFTILDPVGLGRNFAGFMHLADFAESLVNTRIWTEPQQIDQKLNELNVHIETVIQNYLRNEFATIEAYNDQAAEVAEPYRVLVVADFPAGFSEPTARRLAAIAKSGPRCGVYLILGLDTAQPLPPGTTRDDLVKTAVRLSWKDGRFLLRNPAYETFPFTIDPLPTDGAMTQLLHRVGEAARDANRVEVPFEVIAPAPEDYWKGDSGSSLVVPLGRSGATKLQSLRLGRGTSQHVLIAGRTGSGKSTLLHALITNAALIYGPDEVEFYLIDFKKGVEFKTYATHHLPHARVVAIESEREFGLSVLQRLDAELKIRGDLYRDMGVQDVAGFRAAAPGTPMPRILLVVDEFQEFFVEDDKIAQECSLMLDRLVRQGRAFGIHVHLGSQTLSGAYSLARSTLGQMAIRIALQCSEADAHLILNEDNAAARLLSRPGEAIYNDANGQVDGNHVFQVVFLTDARREAYLKSLAQLARDRNVPLRPQIVFEGNRPSDLSKHPAFAGERARKTGTLYAWLGEAVAIKDPTAAAFRAQGGNNLLIIGQNDEMATGVVSAAILGLAAQAPDSARFFALDGLPEESPSVGQLARVAEVIPQPIRIGGPRDAASILSEVAAEVSRRQAEGGDLAPIFLLIHDLPRFRDLRKPDDDFGGFSSRRGEDKPVSPAKLFGTIFRDGPALHVHVIVWCDSLNNANRAFDRQALREFEMRVLFQMSPADSSNLIDSPAASKLGENRAFYSSEEEGRLEKFRPYGLPSAEWLETLKGRWKGA